MLPMG